MKISARNILKGRVMKIVQGAVNSEVTLEVAPGVELVSMITKTSVHSLGLTEGRLHGGGDAEVDQWWTGVARRSNSATPAASEGRAGVGAAGCVSR